MGIWTRVFRGPGKSSSGAAAYEAALGPGNTSPSRRPGSSFLRTAQPGRPTRTSPIPGVGSIPAALAAQRSAAWCCSAAISRAPIAMSGSTGPRTSRRRVTRPPWSPAATLAGFDRLASPTTAVCCNVMPPCV